MKKMEDSTVWRVWPVLLLVLSLVTAACGAGEEPTPTATTAAAAQTTPTTSPEETTGTATEATEESPAASPSAESSPAAGGQQSAECEDYPSGNVEFIVPFTPGGTYDALARLFAQYMPKYLPGDITIPVRNTPGAGGLIAFNQLVAAPPDGTHLQILNLSGLAAAQVGGAAEGIDIRDITYLGQVSSEPQVMFVNANSDVHTLADLQALAEQRPVKHALGGGFTSSDGVAAVILYTELGIEYTPITHEGGSERDLSVIRGDSDVAIASLGAVVENFRAGDLRPILYMNPEKPAEGEPGYEEVRDVQTIAEAGYPQLEQAFVAPRVIGTAPGTPDCIRDILASALEQSIQDPELLQQAEASELDLAPLNAQDTTELVNRLLDDYTRYQEELREAIQRTQ